MIETTTPASLAINAVTLTYGNQKVLNQVSFTMQTGRILALIGPNGAGKSSTMRVMAGLVKPDSGSATLNHSPVSFADLRRHFGYFIEAPSFYNYLTAKQNLDLLIRMECSTQTSDELIERVGLGFAGNKKFSQFSKGMKQRLGIAQALIGQPPFLILDEPFNGLDPEVKEQLMALVVDLAKTHNTGVLVTSHLLADLERMADDFVLLNQGNVHLAGRVSDFVNEKQRVTLLFNNPIPPLQNHVAEVLEQTPNRLLIKATVAETEQLLLHLASRGLAPYSVQRSDLLHEKYMEIAE